MLESAGTTRTKSQASLQPSLTAIALRKSGSLNEHSLAHHNESLPPTERKSKPSLERIKSWIQTVTVPHSEEDTQERTKNSPAESSRHATELEKEVTEGEEDLQSPSTVEAETDNTEASSEIAQRSSEDDANKPEMSMIDSTTTDSNDVMDGENPKVDTKLETDIENILSLQITEATADTETSFANANVETGGRINEVATHSPNNTRASDAGGNVKQHGKLAKEMKGTKNIAEVSEVGRDTASKLKQPLTKTSPRRRDSTLSPAVKVAGLSGQASMVSNIRKWQLKSKDKTTPLKEFVKDKHHLTVVRREWDNLTIELPFPALIQMKKEAKLMLQSLVKEYKSAFGAHHKLTLDAQAKLERLNDELAGPDVFV